VPPARRPSLSNREAAKSRERPGILLYLSIAIWFGIFAGLLEGCGLLLFQHINWKNWAQLIHVSPPIIWISPIVDVVFFSALALLVAAAARSIRRISAFATLIFLLSFLSVYDWITLTGRLYRLSGFLLALGVAFALTRWATQRQQSIEACVKRTISILIAMWFIAFVAIHWGSQWNESRRAASLSPSKPGAPNVLVIIIDTLRADHLSTYGYARETSPNIDRLAKEGVLFENAISPAPWSLPSHVSLVTGRYQFEHGVSDVPPMSVFGVRSPMNGFTTLGEVLRPYGYQTGAFSANLINFTGNLGFSRSFSHFEDFFQSPADAIVRTIYGREFARRYLNRSEHSKVKRMLRWLGWDSILDRSDEGSIQVFGVLGVEKRGATVNQEFFHWLDSSRKDRPFLAYFNYMDVHHPYGGPATFAKPWPGESRMDRYDDGIRYVDDCVGDLMQELRRRRLADNTLVVITSDHGEGLGDHAIFFHGEALYREQIHVPLIFWWPGKIPAGVRVHDLVSSASLPATVVSILDLPPVSDFKRPAVDSLWRSDGIGTSSQEILSEVVQRYPSTDEDIASAKIVPVSMLGAMKALTAPQWKLITHDKLGNQLYNSQDDPLEKSDLFRAPQFQPEAAKMLLDLQSMIGGLVPATSAVQLSNGTHALLPGHTLYRVSALPDARVSIELPSPRHKPKSVLSVTGSDGVLLRSCKNPSDDAIPSPGVKDSTPEEFDDICANSLSANSGSRLEILVPGKGRSPVELYVSVTDWDGHPPTEAQISVAGAADVP